MSLRSVMLAVTLLIGFGVPADSQERVVLRGHVIDASSREPLQGVLVTAPLAGLTVLTDSLGDFSLSLFEDRGYQLVVEDMGYQALRITLAPEAAESSTTIPLPPDMEMLAGLTGLQESLEQRRRRSGGVVRLIEHDELMLSTEISVYTLVLRSVPMANPCSNRPQNLCRLGRSRIRICMDDAHLTAGASELESYEPADVWLVEIYNNGGRVRVYTRWFVNQIARTRQGQLSINPVC